MVATKSTDTRAYAMALSAMVNLGSVETGRTLFHIAQSARLLSPSAFESALTLATKAGDLTWAKSVFDEMKKSARIQRIEPYP